MEVNHIGFWAYCSECNTEITNIKYEELTGRTEEETVRKGYDDVKVNIYVLNCPICGKVIKARRKENK